MHERERERERGGERERLWGLAVYYTSICRTVACFYSIHQECDLYDFSPVSLPEVLHAGKELLEGKWGKPCQCAAQNRPAWVGGGRAGRVACTVQPLVNNIIATLKLKPADTGLKRGVNWCGVMLNLGWCSGGQMQLVGFPVSALLSLQIIGSGGLWMGTVVVTYPLTVSETLKWLLSLPTSMKKSFWCRQYSIRYSYRAPHSPPPHPQVQNPLLVVRSEP